MEFEVIKKNHKKQVIIGGCLFVIIAIVLVARFTFAKYSLVKSIKIAEGTINYKLPDFKIMAMYKDDGNGYKEIDTMPESGYAINEDKSYCNLNNTKDNNAKIYTDLDGNHIISKITKGSKCYLYFDNYKKVNTALGEITVKLSTPDFNKTSCTEGCGESTVGIYQAKDDDGWSYYYRGDVENNYVKFAGFYWRIIRVNGDGSIRLIYDGTESHQNGEITTDSIAVSDVKWSHKDAYWHSETDNAYIENNAYVGFKYTLGEVHGLGTKSNALQDLETWYTSNLQSYASKLDTNAGFCGDRTPYVWDNSSGKYIIGGGTGITETVYGAGMRIRISEVYSPILSCNNVEDLYTLSSSNKGNKSLTYPIGLITADEVSMAGGGWIIGGSNKNYYLNNGQEYFTMSPASFGQMRFWIYVMASSGTMGVTTSYHALRPVINLRADTTFTFTGNGEKGSITNPYIVS